MERASAAIASRLERHPVRRFVDSIHAWFVVRAQRCVPGRRVAVDEFIALEAALQVCSDEVPPPHHFHVVGIGDGSYGA
eukprot:1968222-Pleurochrysis_carterae.AAC.4